MHYYLKLSAFLALACLGGVFGSVCGLVLGFLLSFVAVAAFALFSSTFDPMTVGFLTIVITGILGFPVGFAASYHYSVRYIW